MSITNPRENAGELAAGEGTTLLSYDATFHTFLTSKSESTLTDPSGNAHRSEFVYAPSAACTGPTVPAGAGLVHESRSPKDVVAGTATVRCYDAFGRLTLERAPDDLGERTIAYPLQADFADRRVVETVRATDSGGTRVSTTHLDRLGRVVARVEDGPQGSTITQEWTYDLLGRVSTESNRFSDPADEAVTTFEYDPRDRVLLADLPDAGGADRKVSYFYYAGLEQRTDANGNTRSRFVDPFGNLTWAKNGELEAWYEHDVAGNLVGITDSGGNQTALAYDGAGRRTALNDPNTGLTLYEYDANGNLDLEVRASGTAEERSVSWTHDALDRPTHQYADGALQAGWEYDTAVNGLGELSGHADGTLVQQVVAYDVLGRPTAELVETGGKVYHFGSSYDPLSQIASRTYPTDRTLEWTRDAGGFLTAVGDGTDTYASQIEWDEAGRLVAYEAGDGSNTTRSYVPQTGLLESLEIHDGSGALLQDRQYGFDPADRLTSILASSAGEDQGFAYDEENRLISATGPFGSGGASQTLHYTYNVVGSPTCMGADGAGSCAGGVSLTYPPGGSVGPHQPLTIDGASTQYAVTGELLSWGNRSYTYDPLGRLEAATRDSATSTFDYDATGRRTQATTAAGTRYFVTEDFHWSQSDSKSEIHVFVAGQVVATLQDDFTPGGSGGGGGCSSVGPIVPGGDPFDPWAPALLLILTTWLGFRASYTMVRVHGRTLRPYLAGATAVVFVAAAIVPVPWGSSAAHAASPVAVVYYHGDHLGSAAIRLDGTVVERTYRPFGSLRPGESHATDLGYTGQRYEAEEALYDYGARWYDAAVGRFLQPDPVVESLGDPRTLDPYTYVRNDPINRIDPTGTTSIGGIGSSSSSTISGGGGGISFGGQQTNSGGLRTGGGGLRTGSGGMRTGSDGRMRAGSGGRMRSGSGGMRTGSEGMRAGAGGMRVGSGGLHAGTTTRLGVRGDRIVLERAQPSVVATTGRASRNVELPRGADTLVVEVNNIQGIPLTAQVGITVTPFGPDRRLAKRRSIHRTESVIVGRPMRRRFGPFSSSTAVGPNGGFLVNVDVSSTGTGVLVNFFGEVSRPPPTIRPRR